MKGEEAIYTISLGNVYEKPRKKRAPRAIKEIRAFVVRHAKVSPSSIKISERVNSLVWKSSIEKPPRKIRVKILKKEEIAFVLLPEEKLEENKEMEKKEEKNKQKKVGDVKGEGKKEGKKENRQNEKEKEEEKSEHKETKTQNKKEKDKK